MIQKELVIKISISKKIKAISNKIEQNKTQYNLDRKTAKISALSSGNVSEYELLTRKGVLPEKDLLEKAAAIESFEYFMLGKESKTKPLLQKKQYQKTDSTFASNKNEEDNLK